MVGGQLAGIGHGWVSPMFRPLSGSDLWVKCTSSAELEIHSDGHVLGIGHVTM
jgi:hypothetical protein